MYIGGYTIYKMNGKESVLAPECVHLKNAGVSRHALQADGVERNDGVVAGRNVQRQLSKGSD